jgi:hypothetical protein
MVLFLISLIISQIKLLFIHVSVGHLYVFGEMSIEIALFVFNYNCLVTQGFLWFSMNFKIEFLFL